MASPRRVFSDSNPRKTPKTTLSHCLYFTLILPSQVNSDFCLSLVLAAVLKPHSHLLKRLSCKRKRYFKKWIYQVLPSARKPEVCHSDLAGLVNFNKINFLAAQAMLGGKMALLDDPKCVRRLLETGKKRSDIEATCRALDISRSTFRRLMTFIADLVVSRRDMQKQASIDRRTAAKAKLREQLLVLVDANPLLGCKQLAKALSRESPVSFPTVQKLLNETGLGKKQQRILRLIDQVHANQTLNLSDAQINAIAKARPVKQRAKLSRFPG